jgi:hypothetical protein
MPNKKPEHAYIADYIEAMERTGRALDCRCSIPGRGIFFSFP